MLGFAGPLLLNAIVKYLEAGKHVTTFSTIEEQQNENKYYLIMKLSGSAGFEFHKLSAHRMCNDYSFFDKQNGQFCRMTFLALGLFTTFPLLDGFSLESRKVTCLS